MEKDAKDDIVATAKERFEAAKDFYGQSRILAVEDTKFAMGDSDNGWQWPEEVRRKRTASQKVLLTVNMTAQHCNQIINNIRQNRPASKVNPVDSGADKRTAEMLEGLLRNIKTASFADEAHDIAAEHAVYGGEGYWRIRMDYETPDSFEQVIVIDPITNPNLVYVDCYSRRPDRMDAEWGFIFEDISEEQFKREYPDLDPSSWEMDGGWIQDKTYRQAEYFWCEYEDDTICLLDDGSVVRKSDLPDGVKPVKERKTQRKKWKWCKIVGGHDKPVDERDWPGDYLPIVTVVGKELNVDGEIVRKGIVRDLKDPARMTNYAYSESVHSLTQQNRIPYLIADEALGKHKRIWDSANAEDYAYLPWAAYDEEGKPNPKPERQPGATMANAQIQLLQISTEQMRGASGQQNANFGIKSEASSGIGIQRLKQQGEVATFHFPDNLARALRYEDVVLIDLIQKTYDTRRVVRVLGLDGQIENAMLDPEMSVPFQEMQGLEQDISKIFNPTLGRYDVVINTGPSYQTQRQEAADRLTELATRNPALMQIAGDIIMRAQDFPMSDELADRLAKTLPPNLQDNEGQPQIPPQMAAQFQQMQQQLQQAGQIIQKLQQDAQNKISEIQGKAQAEIAKERIKAQSAQQIEAMKQQSTQQLEALKQEQETLRRMLENQTQLKQQSMGDASAEKIAQLEAKVQLLLASMQPTEMPEEPGETGERD